MVGTVSCMRWGHVHGCALPQLQKSQISQEPYFIKTKRVAPSTGTLNQIKRDTAQRSWGPGFSVCFWCSPGCTYFEGLWIHWLSSHYRCSFPVGGCFYNNVGYSWPSIFFLTDYISKETTLIEDNMRLCSPGKEFCLAFNPFCSGSYYKVLRREV